MLQLLTFTNLYPNSVQPRHGIFVEQRLRKLMEGGSVAARVVAPVPSFPLRRGSFARFGIAARVPSHEERSGIRVWHPRYPVVPGASVWVNPLSMALGALRTVRRLQREGGDFDLIDAQFVYPDGVAGVLLGAWLGKPVVITARGSDVNSDGRTPVARAWIRWAAQRCGAFITVSAALREALVQLGVRADQVTVLRNGVDLDLFRPLPRANVREELRITGPTLLSVGNLVPEKGHSIVIEALAQVPGVNLILIGSGGEADALASLAQRSGVSERMRFIPHLGQEELARYYAAADATVLASSREGMPNVLLESLACGTPVIASDVGGCPEVVAAPEAGILVRERTPAAFAAAIRNLYASPPAPEAVRRYAQGFGWAETVAGQFRLFQSVVAGFSGNAAPPRRASLH